MSKFLNAKQKYFVIFASVVLSVLVVWVVVSGATTISTNISTGGTLEATGLSTLTGGYLSVASSTVNAQLNVSGPLSASSTLNVSGVSTLIDDLVVDTDTLFVDASANNVGVGTSTPSVNAMFVVGEGINTYTGDVYLTGGLTIAATSSQNNSVEGSILFSKTRRTDPTAVEGLLYYSDADKTFRMSDGTNWWPVGTSTDGFNLSSDRIQLSTMASNYLTLGTTTERWSSLMTVEATSTATIPLSIVGREGQLQNLFQVVNSSATELFAIDAVGSASSTSLTLARDTGQLWVGGMATTTGSTGNIATQGTLVVTGATTLTGATSMGFASTTGDVTVVGDVFVGLAGGTATTTAATGNFATQGKIGVGTTTPTRQVSIDSTATTTIRLLTTGGTTYKGSCIELTRSDNGLPYRIYLAGSSAATTTGAALIVEAGICE